MTYEENLLISFELNKIESLQINNQNIDIIDNNMDYSFPLIS
jgi:hypothetical protein